MKKVLIFSLAYYPHVGGAEVAIKEITDRLHDIEFHMVTLRFSQKDAAEEKIGNVRVFRVGKGASKLSKLAFQFSGAVKALTLHRAYHYDAIWAMLAHSTGVPASIFKFFNPKVPYVLMLQEGDPPKQIERTMLPLWPLFSRGFTSADIVAAESSFLAAWARKRGVKKPIEIISTGVETRHFSGKPIDHEHVILITTSRLVHKNAVDVVIRSLKFLPENIHFRILGKGSEEEMLKNLARTEGVNSRVEFAGHIDRSVMPAHLHAADIFVRPSRSEGMGASFIEAMAAGLPVIATQEGGIADFLFDAKRNPDKPTTGWAVDKDSPEQIAEVVKEILANPDRTKEVVENARRLAFEKYDWDLIAKNMSEKVFSRVL